MGGARDGHPEYADDPPSRRITYTSENGWTDIFDGAVNLYYTPDTYGQPTNISFTSDVTIRGFGSNFGTYTQTSVIMNKYTMSDGSAVIVFEVQGTYSPPVLNFAGMSNSWQFSGFTIFPKLQSGGGGTDISAGIRGDATMQLRPWVN